MALILSLDEKTHLASIKNTLIFETKLSFPETKILCFETKFSFHETKFLFLETKFSFQETVFRFVKQHFCLSLNY